MSFHTDIARLERDWGIHLLAQDYLPEDLRQNFALAMDAQPALVTPANSGIPAWMTYYVDPEVIRVLQAPNEGAEILGEVQKGNWLTTTAIFPVVENTGSIASYGDFNADGRSDANTSFPERQSYHFQTHIEYGDREVEQAGEARLSWVAELQQAAALTLNKFQDYTYHYGVTGLQNYGLLNDPNLSAALTPATKTAGGTTWITSSGTPNATANEVFNDVQALFWQLVSQTKGRIKKKDKLTLAMSPGSEVALLSTNVYGKTAAEMIAVAFPNLTVKTSIRYDTQSGNVVQLIADRFDGKQTGYCSFTEKMRDHRIVPATSSYKQKKTSGTFGAVIRYPLAISQMIGV